MTKPRSLKSTAANPDSADPNLRVSIKISPDRDPALFLRISGLSARDRAFEVRRMLTVALAVEMMQRTVMAAPIVVSPPPAIHQTLPSGDKPPRAPPSEVPVGPLDMSQLDGVDMSEWTGHPQPA